MGSADGPFGKMASEVRNEYQSSTDTADLFS